ncbi:MAG: hypothetical protein JNL18_18215 [Planctomycetaceae bacterium]|nr:hypothetical protein [Planctomycetaceae bacterium]
MTTRNSDSTPGSNVSSNGVKIEDKEGYEMYFQNQREARFRLGKVLQHLERFLQLLHDLETELCFLKPVRRKKRKIIAAQSPWHALKKWIGKDEWENRLSSVWHEACEALDRVFCEVRFRGEYDEQFEESYPQNMFVFVAVETQMHGLLLQELDFIKFARHAIAEISERVPDRCQSLTKILTRLERYESYLKSRLECARRHHPTT